MAEQQVLSALPSTHGTAHRDFVSHPNDQAQLPAVLAELWVGKAYMPRRSPATAGSASLALQVWTTRHRQNAPVYPPAPPPCSACFR